jgi:hypothetical protein
MTKSILCCVSILVLVAAATPGRSEGQAAKHKPSPNASSQTKSDEDDCEARIEQLDTSKAEGQERLDEKNLVIDTCTKQYRGDKTIARLVKECAKYTEQPVVKQQSVAECQLAAFGYANALYTLKAEYGK